MDNQPIHNRCSRQEYDAIVIGAGPNGLTAGIVLASEGMSVLIV